MRRFIRAVVALALLAVPTTALAFEDPTTGFRIAPPAPYAVEPYSHRQFDVGVGVNSTTGEPPVVANGKHLCNAGFKAAPQNAGMSREEINAFVNKPEWVNLAKAAFELAFHVERQQRFTLQGYRGIEFQGRPKAGPGHEQVRFFVSLVETAKGRTTLLCFTTPSHFQAAIGQFRAIRASIDPPQ